MEFPVTLLFLNKVIGIVFLHGEVYQSLVWFPPFLSNVCPPSVCLSVLVLGRCGCQTLLIICTNRHSRYLPQPVVVNPSVGKKKKNGSLPWWIFVKTLEILPYIWNSFALSSHIYPQNTIALTQSRLPHFEDSAQELTSIFAPCTMTSSKFSHTEQQMLL